MIRRALDTATPPTTLKQASRAIGMNDAYLQQFLDRGSPRELPERLRHKLADFLGIAQEHLLPDHLRRGISGAHPRLEMTKAVHFVDVAASAGAGTLVDAHDENNNQHWHLPKQWLHSIGNGQTDALKLLSVSGDSMAPKLLHGDIVMIDTAKRIASPPGIFVLHDGLGLVIKQIEPIPNTNPMTLQICSENPAYSTYERSTEEVHIIGRVVWFARTI